MQATSLQHTRTILKYQAGAKITNSQGYQLILDIQWNPRSKRKNAEIYIKCNYHSSSVAHSCFYETLEILI